MALNLTSVKKIHIIGRPAINVPENVTAEATLQSMGANLSDYEAKIEGTTLVLSAPAGSKGVLEARDVNGRLLPIGGKSFPTNHDIETLASLEPFKDDNFFETLEDPAKLQEYHDYLTAHAQDIVDAKIQEQKDKQKTDAEKAIDDLEELLPQAKVYAAKVDNPAQPFLLDTVTSAIERLKANIALAEAQEVAAVKEAQEKEAHEAIVEGVREMNAPED